MLQIWLQNKILLSVAFGELAAIFAAVHLGLMSGDDGRGITVALVGERHQGHVWVHDLAIATEIDTP